jgi:neuroligin
MGAESKLFSTQMSQRIISTRQGRLRGILIQFPDQSLPPVEAYLGLEYASLLGGELRFMPPTSSPSTGWDGVRTALKFKPVCPQRLPDVELLEGHAPSHVVQRLRRILPFLEPQQEDCLYLNIYVPVRERNSSELLPVVLFVHGESYDVGTGNAYDGSVLSAFGRVVVVTFNYRLGVLGFLTTNDSHAPGNYAILDQVAALHWIADNIEAFGGNPAAVTVFGHGAGGVMANLHAVASYSRSKSLPAGNHSQRFGAVTVGLVT